MTDDPPRLRASRSVEANEGRGGHEGFAHSGDHRPVWPAWLTRNGARLTAAPRRYTEAMRRVLVMSSSGFASRTMKSALLPACAVPASVILRNSAPLRVAAT